MNKIKTFLTNVFIDTYKQKTSRDILWFTRLVMIFIVSLLIALFTNLYTYGLINQIVFIILIILSCFIAYYLAFFIISKEYLNYKKLSMNKKYPLIYLAVETLLVSLLLVRVFLLIQSYFLFSR